ncbi:MAG: heparinase II/III family protein [Cyclobacteriaceae bacterium]|nr:heparinase II/III family protein [Cyclobacteriaceae bacterium]
MKISCHFFVAILLITTSFNQSYAQADHQRNLLSGKFDRDQLLKIYRNHPDWNPFPAYEDRAAWENLPVEVKTAHLEAANEALNYNWPVLPATLYMEFDRIGNRSNFQSVYFERREKLANLVVGEMIEGKSRFLDQIINGIWAICEETSWCIPAHIGDQSVGFTPLPHHEEDVVDLFAAETGTTLAWTWFLLSKQLDRITLVVTDRIRHEINKRILTPVMERDDFWWMGLGDGQPVNNWNPWIISNWITCNLVMEEDEKRKAESLEKAIVCLDNFLNIYPDDGGCDEGPGYWGHAGGSLFDCLELLYHSSQGEIDIYGHPLVKNIGSYIYKAYISGPYFINFADASGKINIYPDIVFRYGKRTEDPAMMGFAALAMSRNQFGTGSYNMSRKLNALFSYREIAEYPAQEPLIADFWLPETEIFGARSSAGSSEGLYLAGKGGHNAESHNHNDVGNFIVYYDGKPVIIDIGVEEYRRETFSDQRYTIWTMQSQYHTLPTVNGEMQTDGRNFRSKDISFSSTPNNVRFSVDISGAYPEEATVDFWKRSINFRRGKQIEVTEDYRLESVKGDLFLSFMTPCLVNAGTGRIELTERSKSDPFSLVIDYDVNQFSVETEMIKIEDQRLKPVWGDEVNRIRMMMKSPKTAGKIRYTIKPI